MPTGTDTLTTRQAADLLGCSRQHIADLCDQGTLPHTRTGTHRRIRRADLEPLRNPMTREAEQSLWLHHAVAGKLVTDPDTTMTRAQENLTKHRQVHNHGRNDLWLNRWQRILDEGVTAVLDTITSRSALAVELRQNTPFAGVLTDNERQAVLTRFRAHYRHRRGAAA